MASQFASVKSSATGLPSDRSFSMPPAPAHGLRIAPQPLGVAPVEKRQFDLQLPLNRLVTGRSRSDYAAGQSVFTQDDPANAVFYIQSGKVKLTVVSVSGKEAVIAHMPAASFFGEAALAGQTARISSATALETSSIIRIDRGVMQDLLHREPEFAEQFLAHLLGRNIRMEADLVDHLFNSSEKRLARLLMLMANFGQDSPTIPVIAKISQETLAEMIGTTRSRVSFFLNRFRDLGYISYDSAGMSIHGTLVNVVLHD